MGIKKVIYRSLLFFAPVVLVYCILEFTVLNIPSNYKTIGNYIDSSASEIEVLALGSSQVSAAINPEFISNKTLNLSSGSQHHNTDFKLIKQLLPRLESLKVVLLEVSPYHLEIPHNPKTFWKNSIYLKYYKVNAFERSTYFKDKLIYLSNPDFFSKRFVSYYFSNNFKEKLNEFGYNTNHFYGAFKNNNYNEAIINKLNPNLPYRENKNHYNYNTEYLASMIQFLIERNIKVILHSLPLYKTYNDAVNPNTLARRNQAIKNLKKEYPAITTLSYERDAAFSSPKLYVNHNHLNPDGAFLYSKKLDSIISSILLQN